MKDYIQIPRLVLQVERRVVFLGERRRIPSLLKNQHLLLKQQKLLANQKHLLKSIYN